MAKDDDGDWKSCVKAILSASQTSCSNSNVLSLVALITKRYRLTELCFVLCVYTTFCHSFSSAGSFRLLLLYDGTELIGQLSEGEAWLDMSINLSKSSCLRIGPRNDVVCATITSSTGHSIPWTSEIRYLGVYLVKFRTVKCSLDAAKRGFYRAFNSIF